MNRFLAAAGAVGIVMALSAGVALANKVRQTTFEGTRAQVRAACTGEGRVLVEGGDTTTCMDDVRGTGVTCDDTETCWGTTPRQTVPGATVGAPSAAPPTAAQR